MDLTPAPSAPALDSVPPSVATPQPVAEIPALVKTHGAAELPSAPLWTAHAVFFVLLLVGLAAIARGSLIHPDTTSA